MKMIFFAVWILFLIPNSVANAQDKLEQQISELKILLGNVATKLNSISKENIALRSELAELKRSSVSADIPAGAVITFDNPNGCPSGWTNMGQTWRGRAVVAAVEDTNDKYGFRRTGGEESHVLTVLEIPSHSHDVSVTTHDGSGRSALLARDTKGSKSKTTSSGRGTAHNNMPPYVALYFCKKDAS